MPVCTKCGVPKTPEEFYERRPGLRRRICICCDRARNKKWQIANRAQASANMRKWRALHPFRNRKNNRNSKRRTYHLNPERWRSKERLRYLQLPDDYVRRHQKSGETLEQTRDRIRARRAQDIIRRICAGQFLRD